MPKYNVQILTDENGNHEVHQENCSYNTETDYGFYLGNFLDCYQALIEAKKYFINSNGCYWCAHDCHLNNHI